MTQPRSDGTYGQGAAAIEARRPPLASQGVWIAGISLCAFAIYAWVSIDGPPAGIPTVGAERVLSGEIPYRDFWTMYAPGQFYLLAFLFTVFGIHNAVSVIAGTAFSALAVGLLFRLMFNLTGRLPDALACSALFAAALFNAGYYASLSSYPGVLPWLLAAFNLLQLYFDRDRAWLLFGAGLAIGFAALFKHDVAAYGAVAIASGLLARQLAAGGAARLRAALRDVAVFGFGAACPVLPVVAALAIVAGQDALRDLIVFPATDFRFARTEGYPSLFAKGLQDAWIVNVVLYWSRYLVFALPFLVWLASLPVLAFMVRKRESRLAGFGVAFAVVYPFHYSAAHVQVNTHIISMTFYAACLGALSLHALGARPRPARAVWTRMLGGFLAALWLAALAANPAFNRFGQEFLTGRRLDTATLALPKVSTVRVRRDLAADITALTAFVQSHVPPGQPIYVGNYRHDVIVISRPMLYFILDRPAAVRYHELHPGIADTAPFQDEMVRDLRNKDVRLLVLARIFDDDWLDSLKKSKQRNLPQIGATALDEFIRSNYEQVTRFGEYEVWLAKSD